MSFCPYVHFSIWTNGNGQGIWTKHLKLQKGHTGKRRRTKHLYTFSCYTFCLFKCFVIICLVSLYLLLLYVFSFYIFSLYTLCICTFCIYTLFHYIVLDTGLGYCRDPEIWGTSLRRVCEGGGGAMQAKPSQIRPHLMLERAVEETQATMEETWATNAPYSVEMWHSRVSGQQSKNLVCIHYESSYIVTVM
jgi:hypothetical protein